MEKQQTKTETKFDKVRTLIADGKMLKDALKECRMSPGSYYFHKRHESGKKRIRPKRTPHARPQLLTLTDPSCSKCTELKQIISRLALQ